MTPERWQQVKALIELALEREPAQRLTFLAEACAGDELLYREAEQLIAADSEVESFLENPAHRSLDSGRTLPMNGLNQLPPLLKIGETFLGKYELIRLIGRGGMGSVFQARHVELGTMFAIKVLNSHLVQDNEAIERFKREARTAAKIEHPNTVRVFDYGVEEMTCYLIMEFLKGESLRDRLKKQPRMPLNEVLNFAEQVCDVLAVVHGNGVIHRDLKPDNIFFHHDGEKEIVKLLDFGIAKLNTFTYGSESLTNPGAVFGTPQYMSPEQCQGKSIDGRSDIYSLGIILYEMLAGSRPFDADGLLSYMYAHVNTEPIPLTQAAPHIPGEISKVVMRSLCKEASARFQSAEALLQALLNAAGMTSSPTLELTPAPQTQLQLTPVAEGITTDKSAPRNYLTIAAVAVLILLVGGFGIYQLQKRYAVAPPTINNSLGNGTATGSQNPPGGEVLKVVEPNVILNDENFVLIKGGPALIGRNVGDCPMNCEIAPDEAPAHTVTLLPYYLSKYEVTNREYQEFIAATNHPAPVSWKDGYPKKDAKLPVTNVSWNDATSYCKWRSKRDGIDYRLPTEEEWEHAAHGDDKRFFPWGDDYDDKLVLDFGEDQQHPVKPAAIDQSPNNTFDRSPFGIFALAGNVSEWTGSSFKPYPGSRYQPTAEDLECKVLRGGSYKVRPEGLRTSFRAWKTSNFIDVDLGFRLAVSAVREEKK